MLFIILCNIGTRVLPKQNEIRTKCTYRGMGAARSHVGITCTSSIYSFATIIIITIIILCYLYIYIHICTAIIINTAARSGSVSCRCCTRSVQDPLDQLVIVFKLCTDEKKVYNAGTYL